MLLLGVWNDDGLFLRLSSLRLSILEDGSGFQWGMMVSHELQHTCAAASRQPDRMHLLL